MVGCAACAGRWVWFGVLLVLASDALGCWSAYSFWVLETINKQTDPELKSHSELTVICGDQHWHVRSSVY